MYMHGHGNLLPTRHGVAMMVNSEDKWQGTGQVLESEVNKIL